jgi:hypothetical protein
LVKRIFIEVYDMKIFTKGCVVVVLIASHLASYAGVEALKGDIWNDLGETGTDPTKIEAVAHLSSNEQLVYTAFVPVLNRPVEKKALGGDKIVKPTSLMNGAVPVRGGAQGGTTTNPLKERNLPTLSAYPNPTRGITTLSMSQVGTDNYKIRISNTIGKIVRTIDLKDMNDSSEITLDLSHLPSGIYFYSLLVNEKMIETKRLVLQR